VFSKNRHTLLCREKADQRALGGESAELETFGLLDRQRRENPRVLRENTANSGAPSLSQYISRPPLSLSKILFEQFSGTVLYHSSYNDYFKRNQQLFSVQDFIAQLTQHVPLKALRYIRRYGLYSSRTRGKWLSKPHVLRLAPAGWKNTHPDSCGTPESMAPPPDIDFGPSAKGSQAAWTRLLAKIYEVDPLRCRKCGSEMPVLAVITNPDEVRKILKHLIKIGRSPPGLDPLSLN
jgi:hypothetical protein